MRVFLAERTDRFDVSSAAQFGELTYITKRRFNPFEPAKIVEVCKEQLMDLEFDPQRDFICMTGNPLTIAFLCCAVRELFADFKLLAFDARIGAYRLQHYARNGQ